MNCDFYDAGAYNQCSEPQADAGCSKKRRVISATNFRFRISATAPDKMKSAAARDRLEALFGKQ